MFLTQKFDWRNFHDAVVHEIVISPAGDLLASTSQDGSLVFFDLNNGEALHSKVFDSAMCPSSLLWFRGDCLFVGCTDGTVAILHIERLVEGVKSCSFHTPRYTHY